MPLRPLVLSSIDAGMTRLRIKGGAAQDALYELTNGYVDVNGAPTSRDGTTWIYTLPAGTVGITAFGGKLHVFSQAPVTLTNPLFVNDVLVNPVPGYTGTLTAINFAKPFLGFLYVVATFTDGSGNQTTYHYWLQKPVAWSANTVYGINAQIQPDTPNGFYYQAQTTVQAPVWQPKTPYTVGQTVQPSTANGYLYQCTGAIGTNPTSGTTEPTWPTSPGAQVFETIQGTSTPAAPPTSTVPNVLPESISARYGNSFQVNNL